MDPDSESRRPLNPDPIWIRFRNTAGGFIIFYVKCTVDPCIGIPEGSSHWPRRLAPDQPRQIPSTETG